MPPLAAVAGSPLICFDTDNAPVGVIQKRLSLNATDREVEFSAVVLTLEISQDFRNWFSLVLETYTSIMTSRAGRLFRIDGDMSSKAQKIKIRGNKSVRARVSSPKAQIRKKRRHACASSYPHQTLRFGHS